MNFAVYSNYPLGICNSSYLIEKLRLRLINSILDDLFIYNDGDELISSEILLFLKLYDGIPSIVAIKYIWAIYGFFWRIQVILFFNNCICLNNCHVLVIYVQRVSVIKPESQKSHMIKFGIVRKL